MTRKIFAKKVNNETKDYAFILSGVGNQFEEAANVSRM